MKKYTSGSVRSFLLIIFALILIGLAWTFYHHILPSSYINQGGVKTNTNVKGNEGADYMPSPLTSQMSFCGLVPTFPAANSEVSFPLTIKGVVDQTNAESDPSCGWSMFEGQAGTAQLYYEDGNTWHMIGSPSPVVVDDWMAKRTNFTTTLNFNNGGIDLPTQTPMKVVFSAENPSGLTQNMHTYELPVIFVKSNVNNGI